MDRHGIAIVLEEIATLLEIQGDNRFKVRAFANAARAVQGHEGDIEALARAGRLEEIPGIGAATAAIIRELVADGRSSYFAELRERAPAGLIELLALPHLGASRIRTLHDELGITSLADLERAAREGRVAGLRGFGARTQSRILEGIARIRAEAGRRRRTDAAELAERLLAFVAAQPAVLRADVAGELRRGCETVAGITIVAATTDGTAAELGAALLGLPGIAEDAGDAHTVTGRLADGLALRVVAIPDDAYATTLLFETGSDAHLTHLAGVAADAGVSLDARAIVKDGVAIHLTREEDVYAALDLAWPPPEMRETGIEVEAARRRVLPRLVVYDDLQGCFHCHTTFSDGRATVAEMAAGARDRGWRYLGIADHSQYARYAGGMTPDEVLAQHDEIDAWNDAHGDVLWLFKGVEADILPDGRVDWDDRPDLLERFDYVVASAHVSLELPPADQTRRFLRALENPFVTFLGHLTGRRLLARSPALFDLATVLAAAAEHGVGIEINADPNRLDMDWRHWPAARSLGITAAINPDAHSVAQLDYVHNGVLVARKAWLGPDAILNCGSIEAVRAFFRRA